MGPDTFSRLGPTPAIRHNGSRGAGSAGKRLFTRLDFQRNEGLEAAKSGPITQTDLFLVWHFTSERLVLTTTMATR